MVHASPLTVDLVAPVPVRQDVRQRRDESESGRFEQRGVVMECSQPTGRICARVRKEFHGRLQFTVLGRPMTASAVEFLFGSERRPKDLGLRG
jgi:hypothetical protein